MKWHIIIYYYYKNNEALEARTFLIVVEYIPSREKKRNRWTLLLLHATGQSPHPVPCFRGAVCRPGGNLRARTKQLAVSLVLTLPPVTLGLTPPDLPQVSQGETRVALQNPPPLSKTRAGTPVRSRDKNTAKYFSFGFSPRLEDTSLGPPAPHLECKQ